MPIASSIASSFLSCGLNWVNADVATSRRGARPQRRLRSESRSTETRRRKRSVRRKRSILSGARRETSFTLRTSSRQNATAQTLPTSRDAESRKAVRKFETQTTKRVSASGRTMAESPPTSRRCAPVPPMGEAGLEAFSSLLMKHFLLLFESLLLLHNPEKI